MNWLKSSIKHGIHRCGNYVKATDSTDSSRKGRLARQVRHYYLSSRQGHRWGKRARDHRKSFLVDTQTFLGQDVLPTRNRAVSLQDKVLDGKRKWAT